jgi:nucleotide-binding universal stress UspA family protein
LEVKILLAVDGSTHSDVTVSEIAKRPWPKRSEIRILSVMEVPTLQAMGMPPISLEDWIGSIRASAQTAVETATDKLKRIVGDSITVSNEVVGGSPKHMIVEEADRWGADLIVLGSRGHGTWETLLLGSVPQSVVLHANCSVEVVRARKPTS